ncbi:Mur ligase family protein [Schleiferiaceae bacterium]|nr:Mur ligase family protein [Schleiferiaceae bacterium]|tara:strand:- start:466 stop:1668 length:1203 start_codon:yes stop_codon:yes gene_type:complete
MTYQEAVDWLYDAVPNFQRDGGSKNYKIGLEGPKELWSHLEYPGKSIPTMHVAGTNGKGSSAHLLASGMKEMGLRVGVFSSPHLFDFRERAKISTKLIPEAFVADWVSTHLKTFEALGSSFFELTLMLALSWFEHENVDWVILETGMGGRLDATNICSPEICLITNIGLDHQQFLGKDRVSIAGEKAGIIKPGVPVVIVEKDEETYQIFASAASEKCAPLFWAKSTDLTTDLKGSYQKENVNGAAQVLALLFPESKSLWSLGMNRVHENTSFFGRWTEISRKPRAVVDTGHNAAAFTFLIAQAHKECNGEQHWILGAAADKDLSAVMKQLPKNNHYYWVSTSNNRTIRSNELALIGAKFGLSGVSYLNVNMALEAAKENARDNDLIIISGSTFIIADLQL